MIDSMRPAFLTGTQSTSIVSSPSTIGTRITPADTSSPL